MDLFEAIEKRASVRDLKPVDIPYDDLRRILDAGRRAPSGYNRQPFEFIVIREPESLRKLAECQACIGDVNTAIAVVADPEASKYWLEDLSAATENMAQPAHRSPRGHRPGLCQRVDRGAHPPPGAGAEGDAGRPRQSAPDGGAPDRPARRPGRAERKASPRTRRLPRALRQAELAPRARVPRDGGSIALAPKTGAPVAPRHSERSEAE